ncbi:TPA: AAA family ATPase [Vibrio parahaemolyticus]
MIKRFFITKLFGERNVSIDFESNYKILVAENGYGKTTILNAFYSLLSGDISKLRKIEFSEIGVIFSDNTEVKFTKREFSNSTGLLRSHPIFEHLEEKLGEEFVIDLADEVLSNQRYPFKEDNYDFKNPSLIQIASDTLNIPDGILYDVITDSSKRSKSNRDRSVNKKTQERLNKIRTLFPYSILHLPTYRRVEEDLFPRNRTKLSPIGSINFGMRDVQSSFDDITSEIISSSVEWFSKINGQMLSQLVNGFEITDEMRESISRPKAVEIVLERIGKNIPTDHKEQILNLVKTENILKGHDPLLYFVANLLKVYEQQQENDQAIQTFTKVSNKYLTDKEVVYNESNVTIKIRRKKTQKSVNIETLSSGEKQIISLFAMLYLQKKKDLAIFFDEPELSLSLEWQKTLLPDIINSGKCKFLFSTTHSPFIFENELISHTVDLAHYIEEL